MPANCPHCGDDFETWGPMEEHARHCELNPDVRSAVRMEHKRQQAAANRSAKEAKAEHERRLKNAGYRLFPVSQIKDAMVNGRPLRLTLCNGLLICCQVHQVVEEQGSKALWLDCGTHGAIALSNVTRVEVGEEPDEQETKPRPRTKKNDDGHQ